MNFCMHCGVSVAGLAHAKFCPQCGGGLNGSPRSCPEESTCEWSISSLAGHGASYTCAHGVTVDRHPNGWCNGGCCQ